MRISDDLYENVIWRMKETNSNLSDIVIQSLERELLKDSVITRLERAIERLEIVNIQNDNNTIVSLSRSETTDEIDTPKPCNTLYDKPESSEKLDKGKRRIIELVQELGNIRNVDLKISSILISEGITTPTGKTFTRDIVADTKRKMKKRGLL